MITRVEKNEQIVKDIETEEKKERNKKILKTALKIIIPLLLLVILALFLLRVVGNLGLVVREYPISSSWIPKEFHGLKLVQFSDLHYNRNTNLDKLKEVVSHIQKTNPDIVVFTGDLIDKDYDVSSDEKEKIVNVLKGIKTSIGKYAIRGEEDKEAFQEILTQSDFEILENETKVIYKGQDKMYLTAIDNLSLYQKDMEEEELIYTIVLTHQPDLAPSIIDQIQPDIILAGHSHNGQIRLPFLGPVMKKNGAKTYIDSFYQIEDTLLYISGGIGNSYFHGRLGNHPSINFFRFKSTN